MKKFSYLIFCLLFFPNLIYAKEISIDEFNMKLNFENDWDVITIDDYSKYHDYEEVFSVMNENKIYLYGENKDFELLLVIYDKLNYNDFNNNIEEYAKKLASYTKSDDYELIYSDDKPYVKLKYINDNSSYIVEYNTVYDNKNFIFLFENKYAFPSKSIEDEFDSIIKSIDFNEGSSHILGNQMLIHAFYKILIFMILSTIIYLISLMIKKVMKIS